MRTLSPEPGLYPREGIRTKVPESERRVFSALKSALPAGWFAWHSMRLCAKGHDYAEADFIIACPDRGVLILEVKGGSIRKENGAWYQNKQQMSRSPLDQAHRCRNILRRRFEESKLPCPHSGLAVFFPDTPVDSGLTQDDLRGKAIGSESFPYLDRIVKSMFENDFPRKTTQAKGWISALHAMWCESWIPDKKLSKRMAKDDEIRLKLDREQNKILDITGENERAIVEGVSGSGKSILAMELARREAARDRRVLILSFTESMALEFGRNLADPLISTSSVGMLALALLKEEGQEVIREYTPDFWDPVMRKSAGIVAVGRDPRWDTVIVDEAQDMGENAWTFIEACAGPRSRLWIFTDPGQTALAGRSIPPRLLQGSMKLKLDKPYRCPPAIQALVDVFSGNTPDRALISEGVNSGVIKIIGANSSDVARKIKKEINALIRDGFNLSQIAILSLRGVNCSESIITRTEVLGIPTFQAADPKAADGLICDTFIRFKGLERPAVIVTDLRYVTERLFSRMVIAATRATSALRIIDDRGSLINVPIFRSLMESHD